MRPLLVVITLLISVLKLSIRIWKFTRHSFFFFSCLFTGKHCFSRSAIFIAAIADGCSTVLRQRFRWNEPTLFLWSVDHRFAVQLRSRSGICLSIVHGTLFFMIHSVFLMLFHKATDYVFVHLFCLFFRCRTLPLVGALSSWEMISDPSKSFCWYCWCCSFIFLDKFCWNWFYFDQSREIIFRFCRAWKTRLHSATSIFFYQKKAKS